MHSASGAMSGGLARCQRGTHSEWDGEADRCPTRSVLSRLAAFSRQKLNPLITKAVGCLLPAR